jgi:transposase
LERLVQTYRYALVIHVILDNYRIHDSKLAAAALLGFGGRIRLHFLPPYCPNANKIERLWLDLHANVTRNHHCKNIETLMHEVHHYLDKRSWRNLIGRPSGYLLAA